VSEAIPDRVCVDADSEFFHPDYRRIGVKFDGKVRPDDVQEYCMSEGWIRKQLRNSQGRLIMERGKARTVKWTGKVEAFWRR